MKIEYINTGSYPNSGDGDTLRDAMNKINSNFEEISKILELDFKKVEIKSWPLREDFELINSNFQKIMDKLNENSAN